ncbi:MAG TPA: DUF1329 domain-containing protein [Porticoccaceae bacterium]|nr:DUF1329 domain-containing protein [Porticoccaceae bacterium]
MRIKKYDVDYSRRFFLEKTAKGLMGAGVLTSLWPLIGNTGEIGKAYPEELQSLEAYTKGKVKEGDFITADNVDQVKDLLDPVMYLHVKQMGRRLKVVPQTRDITKLHPHAFLEATLRNQGKAALDGNGNVVNKADGKPWIGGVPFLDPQSGLEAIANLTLTGSHYDQFIYAVRDWDLSPEGKVDYQYELGVCEKNAVSLVSNPDGPYWAGHDDKLKYSAVWFVGPNDVKGTSFLNTWKYDQREFPDLFGYLPAFKRVRRFPSNQRFEPLVPGITVFLSDFWAAGDPMLTWGNHKIVGRQPLLGIQSDAWWGDRDNWEPPVHGGPQGTTFWDTSVELCPEVLVIEAEPTGYPRAPVGKKRVYLDVRNMIYVAYVTFDRKGELWKSFEAGWSQRVKGDLVDKDQTGHPVWGPTQVHSYDVQSGRMSRLYLAHHLGNGMKAEYDGPADAYDKYLTVQAIRRLGT